MQLKREKFIIRLGLQLEHIGVAIRWLELEEGKDEIPYI